MIIALRRTIVRMSGEHECQGVCRVHSDQAPELSGEKTEMMSDVVEITSIATAGFDPNNKCRAERGVRYIQEKIPHVFGHGRQIREVEN